MVTGKEVNISEIICILKQLLFYYLHYTEFLDEELQNEERVIEYFVRDEIGALASTLQVISVSISG